MLQSVPDRIARFRDRSSRAALESEVQSMMVLMRGVGVEHVVSSEIIHHPYIQIGGSDSGAHVVQFSGNGDSPYVLEHFVRRHGKMSLEHAIKRMTSEIADAVSIKDRGVIARGKFADLVIFDPQTITRGAEKMIYDFPDGGGRFVRHPSGIDKVFVNGELMVDHGKYTSARAGRIV